MFPVNFTADARCGGSWTPEEMITTISFLRSITTPSPLLSTRILFPLVQIFLRNSSTTAELCRMKVENAFRSTLSRYSVVDDVGGFLRTRQSMNLELKEPKRRFIYPSLSLFRVYTRHRPIRKFKQKSGCPGPYSVGALPSIKCLPETSPDAFVSYLYVRIALFEWMSPHVLFSISKRSKKYFH